MVVRMKVAVGDVQGLLFASSIGVIGERNCLDKRFMSLWINQVTATISGKTATVCLAKVL